MSRYNRERLQGFAIPGILAKAQSEAKDGPWLIAVGNPEIVQYLNGILAKNDEHLKPLVMHGSDAACYEVATQSFDLLSQYFRKGLPPPPSSIGATQPDAIQDCHI
jgi:hypothetical protein